MFALSRAWQAFGRRFANTHTGLATGRSHAARHPRAALRALGAGVRRLYRYCRQFTQQWENVWNVNELTRTEAELVRKAGRRRKRRALVLLLRQLNHEQRQEFRVYGHFHVTGGNSGNRYRIRMDTTANIDVLDEDGKPKYRLCAGPVDVPVYGMMAGQLLYLQDPASEQRFLQRANIHPAYPDLSREYSARTRLPFE
jgi:hypothetical protein